MRAMPGWQTTTRRERLETAQRRLREHPDDPRKWYWHVQVKVLTFIVSAYGDGVDFVARPSTGSTPVPLRGPKGRSPGIRNRSEIRTILDRIAATNDVESL